MHRPLAEFLTQPGIHRLRKTGTSTRFVALNRNVEELRIDDTPLDEGIDQNVLFLRGDETLGFVVVHGQDATIKIAHVLNHRPLEIQTGLGNHFLDFTQLKDDGELALIDGKHRQTQHHQHCAQCRSGKRKIVFHQRASRSRERRLSRSRGFCDEEE